TLAAAAGAGRAVSVCGDAAADAEALPALVGLGIRAVSVAPAALDEVRAAIRELDTVRCREAVRTVLTA
ncbi:MAG TPA: putative PEP-binding protein, partial [Rugosimonospora sp.]|nr:putative PEP-binding protein [Rugosimonospora sp.]